MSSYVLTRIRQIERELVMLKAHIRNRQKRRQRKLEGLWKGLVVTAHDLKQAESSLFPRKAADGER